jgi:hypothetical protein
LTGYANSNPFASQTRDLNPSTTELHEAQHPGSPARCVDTENFRPDSYESGLFLVGRVRESGGSGVIVWIDANIMIRPFQIQ